MLDNMLIKRKLCTTPAISNARFWAKFKGLGVFFAHNFYIYKLKNINQKLFAWVSAELKGFGFFGSHYS
jgi:hypothetical protein